MYLDFSLHHHLVEVGVVVLQVAEEVPGGGGGEGAAQPLTLSIAVQRMETRSLSIILLVFVTSVSI